MGKQLNLKKSWLLVHTLELSIILCTRFTFARTTTSTIATTIATTIVRTIVTKKCRLNKFEDKTHQSYDRFISNI